MLFEEVQEKSSQAEFKNLFDMYNKNNDAGTSEHSK